MPIAVMFRCPSCQQETDDVGVRKSGYREPYCRPCTRARNRAYYEANKDRMKARTRAYAKANPEVNRRAMVKYDAKPTTKARHADRQAARRAQTDVVLDRDLIFVLGMGYCGLCLDPVDPENWHVDHIIPLAKGGEHSYLNTQPSHPLCNMRKGARFE